MLKLIRNHMETIAGIEIFPLISLVIFFLFFLVLTIYVLMMDKTKIAEEEALPLQDSENELKQL